MTLMTQLERLKRIDALIRRKATGSPEELAKRIHVSRATMFRHIDDLRALGAPVVYDKTRQTYRYDEPFDLKF